MLSRNDYTSAERNSDRFMLKNASFYTAIDDPILCNMTFS